MSNLKEKSLSREATLGVIGLGYVGLPLAVEKAKAGFRVYGFDKKKKKVDMVNAGHNYIGDVVNEDLKDLLPNIKQSTLLIWGTADTATPLSDAKLMEQLLPDAGLAEIPGVGHYSFLENPALFNAIISSFLKI